MKRGITFGTFDVFHYGHLRKFDWVKPLTGCEVLYLPRTPAISTTAIIEKIRE